MLDSLRSRLLAWYSAIVAVVLIGSLAAVSFVAWRSRLEAVDGTLAARVATLAASLHAVGGGTFDLELPAARTASPDEAGLYHVLWTASGQLIDQSDPDRAVPRPTMAGTRTRDGSRELTHITPEGAVIVAGRSLADIRADVWSLAAMIAALTGVALSLSLLGGWWLVTRALAPVDRIGRTAREMVDGDLSARIPVAEVDSEFDQLARALNDAFDQMHAALARQQRFTADASHELRTPLTTLSTELQWAAVRPRETAEYQHSLEVSLRAVDRMQSVVRRLLTLAREDAGAPPARRASVSLGPLAHRIADDLGPLARSRGVTIEVSEGTEPVVVLADEDPLADAVTNLVVNAVQYNVNGGRVAITIGRLGGDATLSVADTGPGIAEADLPHVFDAFYRADPSRARDPGGAGLGLTVTRAIVRGLGGDVVCERTTGNGTTMTIRLKEHRD